MTVPTLTETKFEYVDFKISSVAWNTHASFDNKKEFCFGSWDEPLNIVALWEFSIEEEMKEGIQPIQTSPKGSFELEGDITQIGFPLKDIIVAITSKGYVNVSGIAGGTIRQEFNVKLDSGCHSFCSEKGFDPKLFIGGYDGSLSICPLQYPSEFQKIPLLDIAPIKVQILDDNTLIVAGKRLLLIDKRDPLHSVKYLISHQDNFPRIFINFFYCRYKWQIRLCR